MANLGIVRCIKTPQIISYQFNTKNTSPHPRPVITRKQTASTHSKQLGIHPQQIIIFLIVRPCTLHYDRPYRLKKNKTLSQSRLLQSCRPMRQCLLWPAGLGQGSGYSGGERGARHDVPGSRVPPPPRPPSRAPPPPPPLSTSRSGD
jgi:hypothetical protein